MYHNFRSTITNPALVPPSSRFFSDCYQIPSYLRIHSSSFRGASIWPLRIRRWRRTHAEVEFGTIRILRSRVYVWRVKRKKVFALHLLNIRATAFNMTTSLRVIRVMARAGIETMQNVRVKIQITISIPLHDGNTTCTHQKKV